MNNINNILITKQEIESLINNYINIYYTSQIKNDPFKLNEFILPKEKKIKWLSINSINLLQKAFIHKSFWNVSNTFDETDAQSCLYLKKDDFGDYEKIELIGDKVIDLITLDYITEKFPDKEVGFLTELKSNIVRKQSLANLGEKLGFKKYILFSSHIDRITNSNKNSGRENIRFLEDIFESFVGALYIDQNYDKEIIKPFLLGIYHSFIDLDYIVKNEINYKSTLLKFFHTQKFGHPKYLDLYNIGPPTQRLFISIILLEKSIFFNNESSISKQKEILDMLSYKTNDFINYLGSPEIFYAITNQQDQIQFNGYQNCYDFLLEKVKDTKYILLGVGFGNKKQDAEKDCSKNCLINCKELEN
jgi:ribonuclease-3